jgi:hypothetical protein
VLKGIGAIALSALLVGCAAEPKKFLTSEAQDDRTCRSFMKNKKPSDETTFEECRQFLVDFANRPPVGAPPTSNVTVIVNQ